MSLFTRKLWKYLEISAHGIPPIHCAHILGLAPARIWRPTTEPSLNETWSHTSRPSTKLGRRRKTCSNTEEETCNIRQPKERTKKCSIRQRCNCGWIIMHGCCSARPVTRRRDCVQSFQGDLENIFNHRERQKSMGKLQTNIDRNDGSPIRISTAATTRSVRVIYPTARSKAASATQEGSLTVTSLASH